MTNDRILADINALKEQVKQIERSYKQYARGVDESIAPALQTSSATLWRAFVVALCHLRDKADAIARTPLDG